MYSFGPGVGDDDRSTTSSENGGTGPATTSWFRGGASRPPAMTPTSPGGSDGQPATSWFGIGGAPATTHPGRPSLTAPGGLTTVQAMVRRAAVGSTHPVQQPPTLRPRLTRTLSEPRKGEARPLASPAATQGGFTFQGVTSGTGLAAVTSVPQGVVTPGVSTSVPAFTATKPMTSIAPPPSFCDSTGDCTYGSS
ncbi:hypothetical protein P3T76_006883 [Phytophthora citrophthora]|uniref:Uncharacterized protein n=1 Tax=Phytophthora citrophthora TaxID=4793 RepID=A0AAD9GMY7_9STRA|nr:hypothetical protein P3T76_006883 [Phytophthora citrophthora]